MTRETLLSDIIGGLHLEMPRDRNGSFEPRIVRKGQTRLDGFNERIIALYARAGCRCATSGRACGRSTTSMSHPTSPLPTEGWCGSLMACVMAGRRGVEWLSRGLLCSK